VTVRGIVTGLRFQKFDYKAVFTCYVITKQLFMSSSSHSHLPLSPPLFLLLYSPLPSSSLPPTHRVSVAPAGPLVQLALLKDSTSMQLASLSLSVSRTLWTAQVLRGIWGVTEG